MAKENPFKGRWLWVSYGLNLAKLRHGVSVEGVTSQLVTTCDSLEDLLIQARAWAWEDTTRSCTDTIVGPDGLVHGSLIRMPDNQLLIVLDTGYVEIVKFPAGVSEEPDDADVYEPEPYGTLFHETSPDGHRLRRVLDKTELVGAWAPFDETARLGMLAAFSPDWPNVGHEVVAQVPQYRREIDVRDEQIEQACLPVEQETPKPPEKPNITRLSPLHLQALREALLTVLHFDEALAHQNDDESRSYLLRDLRSTVSPERWDQLEELLNRP